MTERSMGQTRVMGTDDIDAAVVAKAQAGDMAALEALIEAIRDRLYRLALRMVTQPTDAEDATQEILVKILTRLSTFEGDAKFTTWAHRVAVNHLLDRKKTAIERMELSFDMYGDDLRVGLASTPYTGPDAELLAGEVRLACTQAMLTCLDREHRIAYVLGEVFDVSSDDGAYICEIAPAAYRKRLSRARTRVREFVASNCGLVSPDRAACRCSKRVETAVGLGRIDPARPSFAAHPAENAVMQMERLFDAAAILLVRASQRTPPRMR